MELSVVIPCYNEQECLHYTLQRIISICDQTGLSDYEIIFVNDGSSDFSWSIISNFVEANTQVIGLNLSRNFGHQVAVSAGLSLTKGDRILIIDADLQDPPELLPEMMAIMNDGVDVVYGQRLTRNGESWFKILSSKLFYRLLNYLSDLSIPNDTGDFRLISRRVKQALEGMPEQQRYIRGMITWIGFKQIAIPYVRSERIAGKSHYPLAKMLRFAWDGVTGFSIKPLKIASIMAIFFTLLSIVLISYVLYSWFFLATVPGWTSLSIIVSLLGAGQFMVLGVFGEYLGRMYMESKNRPLYVIDEIKHNLKSAANV